MSNLELENKALKEKVETLELRVKVLQCITFCGNELLVVHFLIFLMLTIGVLNIQRCKNVIL